MEFLRRGVQPDQSSEGMDLSVATAELDCSVLEFRMEESDRPVLLSGGVAEAT